MLPRTATSKWSRNLSMGVRTAPSGAVHFRRRSSMTSTLWRHLIDKQHQNFRQGLTERTSHLERISPCPGLYCDNQQVTSIHYSPCTFINSTLVVVWRFIIQIISNFYVLLYINFYLFRTAQERLFGKDGGPPSPTDPPNYINATPHMRAPSSSLERHNNVKTVSKRRVTVTWIKWIWNTLYYLEESVCFSRTATVTILCLPMTRTIIDSVPMLTTTWNQTYRDLMIRLPDPTIPTGSHDPRLNLWLRKFFQWEIQNHRIQIIRSTGLWCCNFVIHFIGGLWNSNVFCIPVFRGPEYGKPAPPPKTANHKPVPPPKPKNYRPPQQPPNDQQWNSNHHSQSLYS